MRSNSVADTYAVHGPPARVQEVRSLLAIAPRPGAASWSGHDLRLWVGLTEQVRNEDIESALTLAAAWGAGPVKQLPVAAHIVLVRFAPRDESDDSVRLRADIETVCAHLRRGMRSDLARRLPRLVAARELPSAVVWAYFFACLSVLLFSIALTR